MQNRIFINNQIRAKEVRVINEDGTQLGIMPLGEALQKAREKNLDLIQITSKVIPPVCKITEQGKYLYDKKKKEKTSKIKTGEIKGIRLRFNISDHDLETRANAAKKFLEKDNKVRIEMKLFGREKALKEFAINKVKKFIEILEKLTPVQVEREIKVEPRGITTIISRDLKKDENKNQEINIKKV